MKTANAYITVQNKKYPYALEKRKGGAVFIECKDANIAQEFLAEDVADLLMNLPNLIVAEEATWRCGRGGTRQVGAVASDARRRGIFIIRMVSEHLT